MRDTLGDDEQRDGEENASVRQTGGPARKVNERRRDRRTGERDREVAHEIQDDLLMHGYPKNGKSIR